MGPVVQRYDYFTNYSREVDMISIMVFAQMDIDRGKSGMETRYKYEIKFEL